MSSDNWVIVFSIRVCNYLLRRTNLRNDRLNLLETTILLIIQIEEILVVLRSLHQQFVPLAYLF